MRSTVWKYTVESIVYGIWKEYRNCNMSLLIPKQTGLRDSTTRHHLFVLALLIFDIVENKICIASFLSFSKHFLKICWSRVRHKCLLWITWINTYILMINYLLSWLKLLPLFLLVTCLLFIFFILKRYGLILI